MREMNVGWKEWSANQHPTHAGEPGPDGRCSCSGALGFGEPDHDRQPQTD